MSCWLCNVSHAIPISNHRQKHRQKSSGIKSKCIMFSGSNIGIHGGTFNYHNRTSKGMDILMEWVAMGAFHNSDELYDAPKCHPHTRVAVLDDIMAWVGGSTQDEFMLWLFGPAGAGKSAIAKRIAELAAEEDLLIADFFFSRTSSDRNTKDRLIATLAYQVTVSIPDTRSYIEDAIERDPAIFRKNIVTQINTLLLRPLQYVLSPQIVSSQKLIIIDGLDECIDSKAQVTILEGISLTFIQHNLPIKFLVVSRPEPDIVTSFDCNKLLKSTHRRLALDDTYRPDHDIRLFFSDTFEQIRLTHPLRSTIPTTWPGQEILETLVEKSSGQFIYASTVVKFIESTCHRPTARLNIILGISPPGKTNPFAELDALYSHLLSSVEDIGLTLRVLSLYVMTPGFASFTFCHSYIPPELFLSLEPGDIQLALINFSSILTYHESSGEVKVLHASLVDFLSDKCRSTIYYIDRAGICADFVRRVLQCVKGPDGILAGDGYLFRGLIYLYYCMVDGQLRSDILHFDFDALINAAITWKYKGEPVSIYGYNTITIFYTWKSFLNNVALEDRDKKEALDRLHKSLESRVQVYQSDWRLQLLLTLTVANCHCVMSCRSLDILLEMSDDHGLHLVDQDALNLRHVYVENWPEDFTDTVSLYVDGDTYSSAVLHCMRFLSNPPKYSERNDCPEAADLIYVEWKDTRVMTLKILCILLRQANTSPELVQFISNNDIHPAVQKDLSSLWEVDVHILAFLSRASVCPNWRIISAIERSRIITHRQPSEYANSNDDEEWSSASGENETQKEATWHLIQQHLDQCCSNAAH